MSHNKDLLTYLLTLYQCGNSATDNDTQVQDWLMTTVTYVSFGWQWWPYPSTTWMKTSQSFAPQQQDQSSISIINP